MVFGAYFSFIKLYSMFYNPIPIEVCIFVILSTKPLLISETIAFYTEIKKCKLQFRRRTSTEQVKHQQDSILESLSNQTTDQVPIKLLQR